MGPQQVEKQQTTRFSVFCAPRISSKVNWPETTATTSSTKQDSNKSTREPTDPSLGFRPSSTGGVAAVATATAATGVTEQTVRSLMASEVPSAIAVSVGARKVLLEDVLLVAVHGARVDLHQASLDKACPGQASKPSKGGDKAFDLRCGHLGVPMPLPSSRVLTCRKCCVISRCVWDIHLGYVRFRASCSINRFSTKKCGLYFKVEVTLITAICGDYRLKATTYKQYY